MLSKLPPIHLSFSACAIFVRTSSNSSGAVSLTPSIGAMTSSPRIPLSLQPRPPLRYSRTNSTMTCFMSSLNE
ncbi:NAD kinase [Pseudomonas syringae pv. actinidiae]|uniref:NAD kinase n=1 Tax=Pseudomonas syringae pv. actinidiae TaxID=103796 RepID=A0AAN4Q086_PSESF|nr:NAD kinase [Pseudomonas syringae pv. actinidiae]